MAKRRVGSRIANLTPDHKKSGIDLFPMCDLGVRHGVGSSRQELQLCFRLHRNPRSARKVMGLQSLGSPIWRDFGTPTQESQEK
jgi:hypothetical protein